MPRKASVACSIVCEFECDDLFRMTNSVNSLNRIGRWYFVRACKHSKSYPKQVAALSGIWGISCLRVLRLDTPKRCCHSFDIGMHLNWIGLLQMVLVALGLCKEIKSIV